MKYIKYFENIDFDDIQWEDESPEWEEIENVNELRVGVIILCDKVKGRDNRKGRISKIEKFQDGFLITVKFMPISGAFMGEAEPDFFWRMIIRNDNLSFHNIRVKR
jgi:hypothetical protein